MHSHGNDRYRYRGLGSLTAVASYVRIYRKNSNLPVDGAGKLLETATIKSNSAVGMLGWRLRIAAVVMIDTPAVSDTLRWSYSFRI